MATTPNRRQSAEPDSPEWGVQVKQNGELSLPEEEIEQTAADRVAEMLSDSSDDRASLKVYRRDKAGSLAFCADYQPGVFEESGGLTALRESWGPGQYQLRLYGIVPGTNRFTVRRKVDITIAEPISLSAPVSQANSELSRVLQMLGDNQREMMRILTDRPTVDPMAQMKDTLGLMTLFREAMGVSSNNGGISEILKSIKEIRGVAKEILPGGEPEEKDPMSMLPQILELVKTSMSQQPAQQARAVLPIGIPQSMQPVNAGSEAVVPAPGESFTLAVKDPFIESNPDLEDADVLEMLLMKANLKKMVGMLENVAITDDSIAEFIADKLPDELIAALENDQWFVMLKTIAPDTEKHQERLTKIRAKVLEFFQDDDPGTPG